MIFHNIFYVKVFKYSIGSTWSTDALYRETKDKIEYFKKINVKAVEMEASAIAAVSKYYFTFYYAGDNLDSVEWEERSLYEMSNIDKKKNVIILALELALQINN